MNFCQEPLFTENWTGLLTPKKIMKMQKLIRILITLSGEVLWMPQTGFVVNERCSLVLKIK